MCVGPFSQSFRIACIERVFQVALVKAAEDRATAAEIAAAAARHEVEQADRQRAAHAQELAETQARERAAVQAAEAAAKERDAAMAQVREEHARAERRLEALVDELEAGT